MKKHLFTALLLLAAGFSEARETQHVQENRENQETRENWENWENWEAREARETPPHESAAAETLRFTPATAPEIRFVGRAARSDDGALSFDWSGSYFSFRFEGTRCAMRAADSKRNYYNVFVDGKPHGKVTAEGPAKTIVLA